MIVSKNSTDLGRGPGPQLKSVELLETITLVHEIFTTLALKPSKKVIHFMGSGPKVEVDASAKLVPFSVTSATFVTC